MKLRNKLVIAQLCVFLVIIGILLTALPELVYRNISVKDREDTMILNEQIMSQLDQNFEELVRFTKIVAEEPELIQKIDQYMSEPNEAKIKFSHMESSGFIWMSKRRMKYMIFQQ